MGARRREPSITEQEGYSNSDASRDLRNKPLVVFGSGFRRIPGTDVFVVISRKKKRVSKQLKKTRRDFGSQSDR